MYVKYQVVGTVLKSVALQGNFLSLSERLGVHLSGVGWGGGGGMTHRILGIFEFFLLSQLFSFHTELKIFPNKSILVTLNNKNS
jgi:hypothetical protein